MSQFPPKWTEVFWYTVNLCHCQRLCKELCARRCAMLPRPSLGALRLPTLGTQMN